MRLDKQLRYAIQFAAFCHAHQLDIRKVAQLVAAVNASARKWENANRGGDGKRAMIASRRAQDEAEGHAADLGLSLEWPGLYPVARHNDTSHPYGKTEFNLPLG